MVRPGLEQIPVGDGILDQAPLHGAVAELLQQLVQGQRRGDGGVVKAVLMQQRKQLIGAVDPVGVLQQAVRDGVFDLSFDIGIR